MPNGRCKIKKLRRYTCTLNLQHAENIILFFLTHPKPKPEPSPLTLEARFSSLITTAFLRILHLMNSTAASELDAPGRRNNATYDASPPVPPAHPTSETPRARVIYRPKSQKRTTTEDLSSWVNRKRRPNSCPGDVKDVICPPQQRRSAIGRRPPRDVHHTVRMFGIEYPGSKIDIQQTLPVAKSV